MNFLNLSPIGHPTLSTSSLLDQSNGFNISMTKGFWLKTTTKAGFDEQLSLPMMDFSGTNTASRDHFNMIMPFKCAMTKVLNQGGGAMGGVKGRNRGRNNRIPNRGASNWNGGRNNVAWNPNRSNGRGFVPPDDNPAGPPWSFRPSRFPSC